MFITLPFFPPPLDEVLFEAPDMADVLFPEDRLDVLFPEARLDVLFEAPIDTVEFPINR